jgi:hypothetical protein
VRVNFIALHAFTCGFVEKVVCLTSHTLSLALTLQTWIDARSAVLNVGIEKMPTITLETVLFGSTIFTLLNALLALSIIVYKITPQTTFTNCVVAAFKTVLNAESACAILPKSAQLTLDTLIAVWALKTFLRTWFTGFHLLVGKVTCLA